MPKYKVLQHSSRRRLNLSRRAKISIAVVLLIPALLIVIAKTPVNAAPSSNPIFATIQDVQNSINSALAPILSAINSLQTQQTNQTTQISNLQSQVNNLKNSSAKSL